MPRKAREKSNSGVYHVMLRGINQQVIFEDWNGSNMVALMVGEPDGPKT